jgi:hypothetical protein
MTVYPLLRVRTSDHRASTTCTQTAAHRYWLVLALTFVGLVFAIVAPRADWTRATAVALLGITLLTALVTSGAAGALLRTAAGAVAVTIAAVGAAAALAVIPEVVAVNLTAVLFACTTLALIAGVARFVQARGVTLQVVLGGVAIYLLLGGFFTYVIAAVATIGDATYFAQGTDGTLGEYVYYSFTVLTTTGFGDLSAATSVGRAIAVVEMLVGQIYLVTVISVLVSQLRGRIR